MSLEDFAKQNSFNDIQLEAAFLTKAAHGRYVLEFKGMEFLDMYQKEQGGTGSASFKYTFNVIESPNGGSDGKETSERIFRNTAKWFKKDNLEIWSAFMPAAASDMAINFDAVMVKLGKKNGGPLLNLKAAVVLSQGKSDGNGGFYTDKNWSAVE